MASFSSILGISSVYQTPSLVDHSSRQASLSLPLPPDKSHFAGLRAPPAFHIRLRNTGSGNGSVGPVCSAVATPNSSILSSDAFKGLDDDLLSVTDYESESEIDGDELAVSNIGLPTRLVQSLEKRGITQLFPIQRAVLVPALEGRDIIARAKTGTGKTLAFGIPILKQLSGEEDRIFQRRGRLPRLLVLAPTRELAKQVENELKDSAPYLSTVCVYGGVAYHSQQNALSQGVDIVVGTPGRITDLIDSGSLKLSEVEYLVLDEADQMLAVGFEEAVEIILEKLPAKRQSMLFSATMPGWVKKLSRKYLDNPLTIDLVGDNEEKLAEGIKLYAIPATATSKRTILSDLVTVYAKGGKTIVFTQTKRDADEVSMALTNSIASEALHGDISQHQRERTLNGFRQGKFTVLVATDVAARGLDIPHVDLIIHYELPNDPETFVHRSGRTGRAGKEGTAILMYTSNQRRTVKSLERDVGCHFEFISAPSTEEVLKSSADQVIATLRGVHEESIEFFTETAEKLMEEQGVKSLAAALAQLSGFAQPPSAKSLITHEQGWMTLQLIRDSSNSRGFLSARSITGFLSDVYPIAAGEVGKIHIIADERVQGAVFDLPEDFAKELLNMQIPPENTITKVTKLPALQDDGPPSDYYGKFSNMDRGSRGGSRDQRQSGGWGRSSGNDNDRFGFRRGGGSRGGGSRGGFNRSQGSRDSVSDWLSDGGRSRSPRDGGSDWSNDGSRSRSSRDGGSDWLNDGGSRSRGSRDGGSDRPMYGGRSGSRERGFAGACFVCGRSGHRASDCPGK